MTIVLMGVSGSGKTTIGMALAGELGWKFVDGDDLHPAGNVAKMAGGIPLDDDDRQPWLMVIRSLIRASETAGQNMVVACSALKKEYRDLLNDGTQIRWVYLSGTEQVIRERLAHRERHFMKSAMLTSQLEILEVPGDAIAADIAPPVEQVVKSIRQQLGL